MTSLMSGRRLFARSAGVAFVLAITTMAMAIGPVAASGAGDRGSVVQCYYKSLGEDSPYWGGKLVRFEITPPTMYSLTSGAQNVAWRFTVERINFEGPSPAPWKQTYISPRQQGSATSSMAAAFTTMGVGVSLPHADDWNDVYYRVSLVLFWYRPNGTVQKKVVHKMVHYDSFLDGEYSGSLKGDYSCPGGRSAQQ